jgi:hypothetical protein
MRDGHHRGHVLAAGLALACAVSLSACSGGGLGGLFESSKPAAVVPGTTMASSSDAPTANEPPAKAHPTGNSSIAVLVNEDPITHYDIDSGGSRRVRAFWGESVTESKRGQTASAARDGLGHYGLNRVFKEPETRLTMCTLEYGTFERESGQKAFRADHWLHKYGDPLGKEAAPVRAAMRRQFYPDTADWKEAVLYRGHQVVRQAIAGVQLGAV